MTGPAILSDLVLACGFAALAAVVMTQQPKRAHRSTPQDIAQLRASIIAAASAPIPPLSPKHDGGANDPAR